MVKLKSPLNSPAASGTLNNKVTYFNTRGKSYAKVKQRLPISRSTAQASIRDQFKQAIKYALELNETQKQEYAALDFYSASCPWYNNFISSFMKFPFEHGKSITRSIQFYTVTIPATFTSSYKDIAPVDASKSVVILLGNTAVSNSPAQCLGYVDFYNDSRLVAYINTANPVGDIDFTCIVLEFNHNYVKKNLGTIDALYAGMTIKTVEIDEVDLDKTFLFNRGCMFTVTALPLHFFYTIEMLDSTHYRIIRCGNSGALYVRTSIVEFF